MRAGKWRCTVDTAFLRNFQKMSQKLLVAQAENITIKRVVGSVDFSAGI